MMMATPGQAGEPLRDTEVGGERWTLPTDVHPALRRARLVKSVATGISLKELTSEVQRLPGVDVLKLARSLQKSQSAPAVAQAMRAQLVLLPEGEVPDALHLCLHHGVRSTSRTGDLSAADLGALLRADDEGLKFLVDHGLREILLKGTGEFGLSAVVRAAVWTSVLLQKRPGWVAALGWLVAEPPECWNDHQIEAIRSAWGVVSEQYGELPRTPVRLEVLVEVTARLERSGSFERLAHRDASSESAPSSKDLAVLGDELMVLKERHAEVRAGALADLAAAFESGGVPDQAAIESLSALRATMIDLFQEVASATGATTATTIREAAHDLTEASVARTTGEKLARIGQLKLLRGPEYVTAEIREIRELAGAVEPGSDPALLSALDALFTAIHLGPGEFEQAIELNRIANESIPSAGRLVMLGPYGQLDLVPDEAASSGPADQAAAGGVDGVPPVAAGLPGGSRIDPAVPTTAPAESGATDHAAPDSAVDDPQAVEPLTSPAPADDRVQTDRAPQPPPVTDRPAQTSLEADLEELGLLVKQTPSGPSPALPSSADRADPHEPRAAISHPRVPPLESDLLPPVVATDEATPSSAAAATADPLYVSLVSHRRFDLAAWLYRSRGCAPVLVSAHLLAAHALALQSATGPNAIAFNDVGSDLIAGVDQQTLDDWPQAQVLIFAAAVRAGLLSPTAKTDALLRDWCPHVRRSGPAADQLAEAVLTYVYSGAYLTPRLSSAVAEAAEREQAHRDLLAEAATLLRDAPRRRIRYAAATDLYRSWMEPTGFLGQPLSIVRSDSRRPEDLRTVRERVTQLQNRTAVIATIDQDARSIGSPRTRRIEAKAREKLIEWAGDVGALSALWVEMTENLAQSGDDSWMMARTNELRERVRATRQAAVAEIGALGGKGSAGLVTRAALGILEDALDLLDRGPIPDGLPEVPSDRVASGMLVLAADLPVRTVPTFAPQGPVTTEHIAACAARLDEGPPGWQTVFSSRAARGDHIGTRAVIELLRYRDPHQARRLSTIRDQDVAAAIDRFDVEVARLNRTIDADRRFGRLDNEAWSDLASQARAYEPAARGVRHDFDVMTAELSQIGEARDKRVSEVVKSRWDQLENLQNTGAVTDLQTHRISECLNAEDITTADEYLETISSGRQLPSTGDQVQHLDRFFPAFPDYFANRGKTNRRPSVLTELRTSIEQGRRPVATDQDELLCAAGIDLARINRPTAAAARLELWQELEGARILNDRLLAQFKPVLDQIGFVVSRVERQAKRSDLKHGTYAWADLTGVTSAEGGALIPAFGTKISPAGNTLRLLVVWKMLSPGALVQLLHEEPADQSVVILYFGVLNSAQRLELVAKMRSAGTTPPTVVIDDAAFAYLTLQPSPRLDTTMSTVLPFAVSSPFTPQVAGLVPAEMFHGREEELGQVIDMHGSCLVYGGRQLGKSALLRAAARRFETGENRLAIYESIYDVGQGTVSAEKVWTKLWQRLSEKGVVGTDLPADGVVAAVSSGIKAWLAHRPGRQLLLLLDESDFFLDADAKDGKCLHVAAFRALMEQTERAVKVVFAGLHQTVRFERMSNYPLAHFGSPVCVGPLSPQHAYNLLTEPLRALGYRFDDENVASRVLALANNQPSLIQLFGACLLTHLRTAPSPRSLPQTVTIDDVEAVWSAGDLRGQFRSRFELTLNLDPRYKIIAYTVAYHAHSEGAGSTLTPTELRSQCEQWWPQGFAAEDVVAREFRALLDECVTLGVLSGVGGGDAFRLRTPNILSLLGNWEEIADALGMAETYRLPESFDGSLLRPQYLDSVTRGPLTSAQIADLLAGRSQVRLITGSDALTIDRCVKVLRAESGHAVLKSATASTLEQVCSGVQGWAGGKHAVVVADLRSVEVRAAVDAWTAARAAIRERSGGTLGIILIAGPRQTPLWVQSARESDASSSVVSLHRYDSIGLRLWLNDTQVPYQDDASRAELLTVTGGWPDLLNRVCAASVGETGYSETGYSEDALGDLRDWLGQPANAARFVASLGIDDDRVLSSAWLLLRTMLGNDSADHDLLADLVGDASDDPQYAVLRPESLRQAGYPDTSALIEVFRRLGLLVSSTVDGCLRLEPVSAAASVTALR